MMLKRIVFMVAMFLAGVFIMEARAQEPTITTPADRPTQQLKCSGSMIITWSFATLTTATGGR